ncbi:AfsR/SARP family transcriptional regulator [Stackebrandtia nassauensis]|uniref:Transcriptional regulator, SARP family n=1 Tax=Stackebrandtia nassauensis (strain DSM 44728 / CIP 108903 / NRRL B-16338 / NBRC 102104 / LLR-40K-21) TaxID=446470 RepID=D3QAW5_STANL|nr:BTAD domain-containing putative transcriptional regulator [Stackebrandtia nassauensis]ADD44761.1 transcriptional regulator, SARP family [Stackebrandtia nassauensis DSM 44728]
MAPRFRLLGPVHLDGDVRAITPATHLRRGLLVSLATRPNHTIAFERLLDCLWTEPTRSARSNLRTQLSLLRKDLESAQPGLSQRLTVIRGSRSSGGDGGGVRLDASDDEIDVLWAQDLLNSAIEYLRGQPQRLSQVEERCRHALGYFSGDIGVDLPSTAWFDEHRERVRRLRLSLLETQCTVQLLSDRPAALLRDLADELESFPFREPLWRLLITGPAIGGDIQQSLSTFNRCRMTYGELGLDPPGKLIALQRPLLDNDTDVLRKLLREG